jgi:membrane protease YdiL (CAAX protease family)
METTRREGQPQPSEPEPPPIALTPRFLVVGLLVPLTYQVAITLLGLLAPATILSPQQWVVLHLLTGVLFVSGPLLATGLPFGQAWRALGGRRVPLLDLALIVLLGTLGVWVSTVLYNIVMQTLFGQQAAFGFSQSSQDLPLFLLFAVLVGPLGEEVLFRGYLGVLIRRPWVFVLVSAATWSALHVDPYNALPLFWAGLLLAWLRLRTRSFYPTYALHVAVNLLALALHYAMPR